MKGPKLKAPKPATTQDIVDGLLDDVKHATGETATEQERAELYSIAGVIAQSAEIAAAETGQAVKTKDITELTKTTMFFQLSFRTLGNERTAPGTEQDIKTTADKTLLKVKKSLFGKSPEYKAIRSNDAKLKREIDKLCVEGVLDGVRTVPNGNIDRVFNMCVEYEFVRTGLVEKFSGVYPTLHARAKEMLGPLFKADDYPTPENVKAAFGFTYFYVTLDVPGSLKAISGTIYQKQIEQRGAILQSAASEINRVKCATMQAVLDKFKDELSPGDEGKSKKFKSSTLKKLQKFVDDYDIMDVTNFAELKVLKDQCSKLISGITVDNIKSSEDFKASLLKDISGLSDLLRPLVEETGRALKIVN